MRLGPRIRWNYEHQAIADGIPFKTLLVLLWRLWQLPVLRNLLVYYDPGAFHFAERMTRLFFDHKGITMAPGSPAFFEIFLVIGFGIECFVLGFVVQWVLRRFGSPRSARSMHTTR